MQFTLQTEMSPTGDQPQAIKKLVSNLKAGTQEQVLLGVTGSGKTFTIANVLQAIQKPMLVISHNKTLAAQLYQEFKSFFPKNAVSYFVSYYDYYQPEAYIPQSDTYIEKETQINDDIDRLRLSATTNILTRSDSITVASVSCIYNIGSPKVYGKFVMELKKGMVIDYKSIVTRLVDLQYEKSDYDFDRGTFRVRGDMIDIYPAYTQTAVRLTFAGTKITQIDEIDPLTSDIIATTNFLVLYPAKHYLMDTQSPETFKTIESDLQNQVKKFTNQKKYVEAQRLQQKVHFDLEMIKTVGYVNGIENYSRYFDGRKPGDPPYTLIDYYTEKYGSDWILIVDESHMSIPQIRGMYNGDVSRKQTLIDFGFRLPAALDNRPLKFDEFLRRIPKVIYVSATPSIWEISRSGKANVIQQLIRPTGLIDPEITVKPTKNQIPDLIAEIKSRTAKKERVLVTTLTKKIAEDLSAYLKEQGILVHYLHSDIKTLERTSILDDLRQGKYDVIVGINLLREGLDLPEVSLVAILDADKEGFLRSEVSLIQTMGRAARHISGKVIMYADRKTASMTKAIDEVNRRRKIQLTYNRKNNITAKSISKPFRENLFYTTAAELENLQKRNQTKWLQVDVDSLTPKDKQSYIRKLEKEMRYEAQALNFELAAKIRDKIRDLKSS
jgi:excinuclease ABC subunit B